MAIDIAVDFRSLGRNAAESSSFPNAYAPSKQKMVVIVFLFHSNYRLLIPHEARTTSQVMACSARNRGNLGEVFLSKKCFRTPAVLGKSSAIPVCLSESCLSNDVTRALRYSRVFNTSPVLSLAASLLAGKLFLALFYDTDFPTLLPHSLSMPPTIVHKCLKINSN